MNILLIGNYPLENSTSMPRYAELLRRELSERGHRVKVLRPTPLLGRLRSTGAVGKWLGYADKYLLFRPALRKARRDAGRGRWDVLHVCDQGNSMYLGTLSGTAVEPSITCHDVLAIQAAEGQFPGVRVSRTGKLQQRWIRRGLVACRAAVAVSRLTARELARMGCKGEVDVIGQPLNNPFFPETPAAVAAARARAGVPEGARYLLHVGGNTWYKNRDGALRIFAQLRGQPGFADLQLVMAGHAWTGEMRAIARDEDLRDSAHELTSASDSDLRALYTGAEALLFPSLAEGFGWPVLEAQSCGCAVITSSREPLTEVAGDAALFINPDDATEAAREIAARWSELVSLRERGFENVRRFEVATIMAEYERFFARRRLAQPRTHTAYAAR